MRLRIWLPRNPHSTTALQPKHVPNTSRRIYSLLKRSRIGERDNREGMNTESQQLTSDIRARTCGYDLESELMRTGIRGEFLGSHADEEEAWSDAEGE